MAKTKSNAQITADTPAPNTDTQATTTAPVSNAGAQAPTTASKNEELKTVKIKLPLSKEQKDDVFVSVNDKKYQIKRGIEVDVPWFVAEILKNKESALETLFENQAKAQENVL